MVGKDVVILRHARHIQHRFNAAKGSEDLYYRLKESYRDVRGVVHSLIVLNIGFEPMFQPNQIRKIASALSVRMKQREENVLFDTWEGFMRSFS